MGKLTVANLLFWCLAGLSSVMLVALVLVVGGFVSLEPAAEPIDTQPEAATTTPAETVPAETMPAKTPTGTGATNGPIEKPVRALVVLTAARGDSWFSARLGSEDGRLLDERVLGQGESVRLEGARIWLSVGAAGNVDMTVDGRPRALEPGTVSFVLTPSGRSDTNSGDPSVDALRGAAHVER